LISLLRKARKKLILSQEAGKEHMTVIVYPVILTQQLTA
jgi:hypothetical protein